MGIIVSCGVDDIMDVIGMQGSKTGVAKKSLHLITNNPVRLDYIKCSIAWANWYNS